MISLLIFLLCNYKINNYLDHKLPCPRSSKYFISIRKAYDKFQNLLETTSYENSMLDKYSECVVKYHISKKRAFILLEFESKLINCCDGIEDSQCINIWASHTLSCFVQNERYIFGNDDVFYRNREIDQNYKLTTVLRFYLIEQKRKLKFINSSNEENVPDTKWIPCPTNSVYLNSIMKSLSLFEKRFNEYHMLSKLDFYSQCFWEYIFEKGSEINPELEYALYECCDEFDEPDCKEVWTINILSCWIEQRFFYLRIPYNMIISKNDGRENLSNNSKYSIFEFEKKQKDFFKRNKRKIRKIHKKKKHKSI